jgi:hypothetical protein
VSITSVDDLIAGALSPVEFLKQTFTGEAAGEMFSPFFTAGYPAAAAAPTGINGAALTSYAGQLPFPAAVTGKDTWLADFAAEQGGAVGSIWLCDRLWHNGSVSATTTTGQAITHPGIPARDRSGATAGNGVLLGLEVSGATGNGAPVTTITATYTDEAGNTGNTASIPTFPATAVAGHFSPFSLAAGDAGVRSVQTLTLGTTLSSGTVHLVQYRPVVRIGLTTTGVTVRPMPGTPRRMFDSSVPMLLYRLTGTGGGQVSGSLVYSQH